MTTRTPRRRRSFWKRVCLVFLMSSTTMNTGCLGGILGGIGAALAGIGRVAVGLVGGAARLVGGLARGAVNLGGAVLQGAGNLLFGYQAPASAIPARPLSRPVGQVPSARAARRMAFDFEPRPPVDRAAALPGGR